MVDPGNTNSTALRIGNLSTLRTFTDIVGTNDLADVYQFNVTRDSLFNLALRGLRDDIAVSLVYDLDNDGVWDSGEDIVTVGDFDGDTVSDRLINTELSAGSYFVWVFPDRDDDNSSYNLSLSARALAQNPVADPGNTLSTALNIGNLSTLRTFTNLVGTADQADVYRFNVTRDSLFNLALRGLRDDIAVSLVYDLDNDGVWDSGEDILTVGDFDGDTVSDRLINTELAAGSYFVWVFPDREQDNSSYNLSLSARALTQNPVVDPGETLDRALNIGNLSAPRIFTNLVGTADQADVYRFNIRRDGFFNLRLTNLKDDIAVSLIADTNNNGVFDNGEAIVTLGDFDGDTVSDRIINQALSAGTYFVWVFPDREQDNSSYKLEISSRVATPSNFDDYIVGTFNNNAINGLGGNDYLFGEAGNDNITGATGNDTLLGDFDNDTLDGGTGNDILLGGAGSDRMVGGVGNDNYYVDSRADVVVETSTLPAEIDSVYSSVSYSLGANTEKLFLISTASINGTGNSRNNLIQGNAGNNLLNGGTGNDTLIGTLGNDTLIGSFGNDVLTGGVGSDILNGGVGNDTMIGSVGNDIYGVNSRADVVIENSVFPTEIDSVYSSISYSLGANLERLFLTGTAAINGTGNNRNNLIQGNAGNNLINAGIGNDTLIGAAGNDTLVGSFGNDVLAGGVGSDRFIFQSPNQKADRITDFNPVNDLILVSARGFGGGLVGGRALAPSQFRLGAVAADANDRFIYNRTNGVLFFDGDGSGDTLTRIAIASLTPGVALTSADIFVSA
ncbi:calcium-binding protein [Candidatus Gracilibacteria bacterium]|nr:calcium-binding protein [Candidatus Gracilibacteria bacterium]NJM88869.1 calcium-binding protein [Hydrococcus sp. RU_2_2]